MSTATDYNPPYVLRFVGTLLAAPRKEYSRDISEFLAAAPNTFARENYISGLIFLVCIWGGFLFLWSFVLVWMSFHGEYVGCAAGRPFEAAKPRKKRKNSTKKKTGATLEPDSLPQITVGDVEVNNDAAGSCSDMDDWSDVQASPNQRPSKVDSSQSTLNSQRKPESIDVPRSVTDSCRASSKPSSFGADGAKYRITTNESVDETHAHPPFPSMRERRTQFCFFLFAFASLLCVPLILALTVKPLLAVTEDTRSILDEESLRLDDTRAAFDTLNENTNVLSALFQSIVNTTYTSICPMNADVESTYNLNFEDMYNLLANQDARYASQWKSNINETTVVLESQVWVMSEIGRYTDVVANYAWMPPALVFLMGSMIVLVVVGVYLAWDRESSLRFQNLLSYAVLPVLITCSLACWIIVFGSAVTTSIAFDFCLSEDSPSQTIELLIQQMGYTYGSSMHDITLNYVQSCPWEDPTDYLDDELNRLKTITELVQFTLSQADNVENEELSNACGVSDGELENFLRVSSDIVSEITEMQAAIRNATSLLECENISDTYDALINGSICDVGAAAFAWSFVFFLVAGVSTMAMISMRASWRYKVVEDKIFDESEVAENMVVDEHEEYLTFISKYRQEWEEYQGVSNGTGAAQLVQGSTDTLDDSFSTISNHANMTDSLATDTLGDGTEVSEIKSTFDPYNSDSQSNTGTESDGSISFLSLKGSQDDVMLPPLLGSDIEAEENFDTEAYGPGGLGFEESHQPKSLTTIVDRTPPSLEDETSM